MMGGEASLDLSAVPEVVFTDPQIVTVGLRQRRRINWASRSTTAP
jgi:pyruvate/2-oxoglutarate dehydrogenase complex dihydrolipoamide dehydrogenase (E3) component